MLGWFRRNPSSSFFVFGREIGLTAGPRGRRMQQPLPPTLVNLAGLVEPVLGGAAVPFIHRVRGQTTPKTGTRMHQHMNSRFASKQNR